MDEIWKTLGYCNLVINLISQLWLLNPYNLAWTFLQNSATEQRCTQSLQCSSRVKIYTENRKAKEFMIVPLIKLNMTGNNI